MKAKLAIIFAALALCSLTLSGVASFDESQAKSLDNFLPANHLKGSNIEKTDGVNGPPAVDGPTNCSGREDASGPILSREAIRNMLINDVEKSWLSARISAAETPVTVAEIQPDLEEKLRTSIVPKICFVDTPLRDALDMIAEAAEELEAFRANGLNIIILDHPSESARVHLTLRESSLGKILEFVAQSVGYEIDIEDNAVIFTAAEQNKKRLATKVFPISRAAVIRLTNLRETTDQPVSQREQILREESLLKNFFERSGINFQRTENSSLAFDGSNLIVTQTPKNLKRMADLLRNYQAIQQVEIEIKFLEVQQGLLNEWQFRLGGSNSHFSSQTGNREFDNLRDLSQGFADQNLTSGNGHIVIDDPDGTGKITNIAIPNRPPSLPNSVNLASKSVPLLDVLGIVNNANIGFMLKALEQQTGSDLMSAPKIMVLSGKTAEIVVAQELRYPEEYDAIRSSVGNGSTLNSASSAGVTITAGTPRNFKVRNIGVEMAVTPIVEADNRISLQLEPSVTAFEGFMEYGGVSVAVSGGSTVTVPSGFFQPIFSTRRIRTEVTIENGATVVMGGLTREEVKEVRDKVPLLGDLPVLGKMFRSHGKTSQKRNLLIFVTARLIDPQGTDGLEGEIIHRPTNHQSQPRFSTRVHRRGR